MRRSGLALLLLAGAAHAGPAKPSSDAPAARSSDAPAAPSSDAIAAVAALHDQLAHQLAAETDAVDRARAQVADKIAAADHTRGHRLRAAYHLIEAAPGDDAMAVARRRAAARLLLDRDLAERGLLTAEDDQLRAARDRIAGEAARVDATRLPPELRRPAAGPVVRHAGTLVHDKSRATLSRRGIDLEVDDHAVAVAPAAGTVRYAGPIRGLDQGVVLDHGGYLTVIAKLGDIALPVGAPIAAGDRLGRAARHRIYFEVRIKSGPGGYPIDPEPLLPKSR